MSPLLLTLHLLLWLTTDWRVHSSQGLIDSGHIQKILSVLGKVTRLLPIRKSFDPRIGMGLEDFKGLLLLGKDQQVLFWNGVKDVIEEGILRKWMGESYLDHCWRRLLKRRQKARTLGAHRPRRRPSCGVRLGWKKERKDSVLLRIK